MPPSTANGWFERGSRSMIASRRVQQMHVAAAGAGVMPVAACVVRPAAAHEREARRECARPGLPSVRSSRRCRTSRSVDQVSGSELRRRRSTARRSVRPISAASWPGGKPAGRPQPRQVRCRDGMCPAGRSRAATIERRAATAVAASRRLHPLGRRRPAAHSALADALDQRRQLGGIGRELVVAEVGVSLVEREVLLDDPRAERRPRAPRRRCRACGRSSRP